MYFQCIFTFFNYKNFFLGASKKGNAIKMPRVGKRVIRKKNTIYDCCEPGLIKVQHHIVSNIPGKIVLGRSEAVGTLTGPAVNKSYKNKTLNFSKKPPKIKNSIASIKNENLLQFVTIKNQQTNDDCDFEDVSLKIEYEEI